MVRLREIKIKAIYLDSDEFQFQYGAIKRVTVIKGEGESPDFNSSMVRLRDLLTRKKMICLSYFNSSMVRLREHFVTLKIHFNQISIPVWCD